MRTAPGFPAACLIERIILLPLREDRADFVVIAGCSLHFLNLPDGVTVLLCQLGQKPGILAAVDILGQYQR